MLFPCESVAFLLLLYNFLQSCRISELGVMTKEYTDSPTSTLLCLLLLSDISLQVSFHTLPPG